MKKFHFKGKSIVFVMFLLSFFVFSTFAAFKVFNFERKGSAGIKSYGTSIWHEDSGRVYTYGDFENFLLGVEFDDFAAVHYDGSSAFEIYEAPKASSVLRGYDKGFSKSFRFDDVVSTGIVYEGYKDFLVGSKYNYKYGTYDVVGKTSLDFENVYVPMFEVFRNNPENVFNGDVYFTGPNSMEINDRFETILRESGVGSEGTSGIGSTPTSMEGVGPLIKYILVSVALLFFCVDIRFLLRYWIGYTMDDIFSNESSSLRESDVSKVFTRRFSFLSLVGTLIAFVIVFGFLLFAGRGFVSSFTVLAKGSVVVFVGYLYCLSTVGALVSNFYSKGSF